jgi:hypothetical protein
LAKLGLGQARTVAEDGQAVTELALKRLKMLCLGHVDRASRLTCSW